MCWTLVANQKQNSKSWITIYQYFVCRTSGKECASVGTTIGKKYVWTVLTRSVWLSTKRTTVPVVL